MFIVILWLIKLHIMIFRLLERASSIDPLLFINYWLVIILIRLFLLALLGLCNLLILFLNNFFPNLIFGHGRLDQGFFNLVVTFSRTFDLFFNLVVAFSRTFNLYFVLDGFYIFILNICWVTRRHILLLIQNLISSKFITQRRLWVSMVLISDGLLNFLMFLILGLFLLLLNLLSLFSSC